MKRDYYSPYLQVEPEGEDENWPGFLVSMERLRDSHRFPRTRYSPGAGYGGVIPSRASSSCSGTGVSSRSVNQLTRMSRLSNALPN